jgi:hypothetical protein
VGALVPLDELEPEPEPDELDVDELDELSVEPELDGVELSLVAPDEPSLPAPDDPLSPEPVESVLVDTVVGDVDDDPLLLSVL